MGLILTAELCDVDGFDDLVALECHRERACQAPAVWMAQNPSNLGRFILPGMTAYPGLVWHTQARDGKPKAELRIRVDQPAHAGA